MGAPALDHCPLMPTYGPPTLQLVRGEGSWLWDKDGRQYLDLLSGLAVTGLGHSHPAVADALHEQAQTLLHVSNLFGTDVGWEVACTLDRLLGVGPDPANPAGRPRAREGRCSSPTPVPRPTSAPSSWRGSSADAVATSS